MSGVTTQCRDINELKAVAQQACRLFMEVCKKSGLDIFITETYRSQARQNYLYEQGRTRPGIKITWTRNSRHTSRLAWDIAANGPELYDKKILKKAGEIARQIGITWGGDWKDNIDEPHFEVQANWIAPINISNVNEEKKESVRMFTPSNNTLKNEFVKMLEKANKDGIISSKEWIIKAKEGRLSLDDAIALTATIQNRSK